MALPNLTEEQKRLLSDYDPALREAKVAAMIESFINAINDLEARVVALETAGP